MQDIQQAREHNVAYASHEFCPFNSDTMSSFSYPSKPAHPGNAKIYIHSTTEIPSYQ